MSNTSAPSEKVVKQLPSEQVLKNYGRSSKLLLAEKDIPDLHFDVMDAKEKNKMSERADVMVIMNVDTKESTQNSDSREHSRNSLESVGRWSTRPNESARERREEDRSKAAQGNQQIQRTFSRIAE